MIKTTTFKKGTVSFSDQGKGRVVVLLHGYLGSKEIWEKNISELAKTFRVIAIDLPGHGQTACYGYVHSMELMAKCVKKVMDSLRLKKYVVVGHSMGGYTTLAFAELFPENLCGLCLCHSTALPDSEEKKKDRARAIKLVKANKRVYTKDTIKNLFATKNLKYLKDEVSFATKIALSVSKQGAVASLEGMKDRPNRDIILGMVSYPVMMIIGEHDNILPYESLLAQSETIRNKHVLVLEHDGHMGFLESPLVVNKGLKKFINKCF
ncbi:MAG: alpha/beta hydrolase [Bacteroidia bacterium]|jgi:pimeloyl-ACP methyl ester carboxylesterase|nr:alpha/beta hydrolase [Sphingobacteriaceae bacterium]MBK7816488.1 alpha/beta hydrolase [Sphingobacteriaceae bacterium]MBP9069870.1 alpha/beta hydrolase [Bacteroidia bacterium]